MADAGVREKRHRRVWLWRRYRVLLFGLVAVAGAIVILSIGRSIGRDITNLEAWIDTLGAWGPLAIIIAVVLCTPLLVPDSLFLVTAGFLYGPMYGLLIGFAGELLAASLMFVLARRLLRKRIDGWIAAHPRVAAIDQAVSQRGFSLMLLLRMTPMSAGTLNYILSVARVGFMPYLIAWLGALPACIVTVYLGYAARHATVLAAETESRHGSAHHWLMSSVMLVGLFAAVLVTVVIGRLAMRAIRQVEAEQEARDAADLGESE